MASQEDWISRNYVATRATTEFEWESTEFYLNLEKPNTITVYTILPRKKTYKKHTLNYYKPRLTLTQTFIYSMDLNLDQIQRS